MASRDRQAPDVTSKFTISPVYYEKNRLPDLLPDNFLGKMILGNLSRCATWCHDSTSFSAMKTGC
jgi:hypothetical protein